MKKFIGITFIFVLFFGSATQIKAEWLKDQQGEYFSNEDSISHFYDDKAKDFVKPVKLPQYYQADAR